jgi:transcriptional regulator with XRE-family HTH domain
MYHNCDMNELGKRLRDARNARGLTQKELSRKSGVSQATMRGLFYALIFPRNQSAKPLSANNA